MEQLATTEVRRASQLTQIPFRSALVIQHRALKYLGIGGKVAAENDHKCPKVADQVGNQITAEHR